MNRTTAILVALATLLAHILAIHQNLDGTFGPPFEIAHVAFRSARNLVYEGSLAWTTGGEVVESYPSPLWVMICASFTRMYAPPTIASQYLGILCALATVIVLAQFSAARLAGLVALLLFVATGTTASAAASGTEFTLVMLTMAIAFLAYERRWKRGTAIALCALIVTRTDLWVLVGGLFVAEALRARRRDAGDPSLMRAFLPPVVLAAAGVIFRWVVTDTLIAPTTRLLLQPDAARIQLGVDYVTSFFLRSGSASLVIFPIWYLLRGQLSGTGRRALALVGLWSAFVAVVGGDGLPFWMAMAPVIPLLFLAIQEAMIIAMDSQRPWVSTLTWALFVTAFLAAGFVSRVPTDIGGVPLRRLQLAWMRPSDALWNAYGRPFGRRGLMQELAEVEELRTLAVFLRDRLDPGTRILTPWPGAIGYISRQDVVDLLGRTTAPADGSGQRSWYGMPRLDIAAGMSEGYDYIVPMATSAPSPPRMGEVVRGWIERSSVGDTRSGDAVVRALSQLRDYELISVPVPRRSYRPEDTSPRPYYVLRNRGLKLQPDLQMRRESGGIAVLAQHSGHPQVVDLEVLMKTPDGQTRRLRPTGEFVIGDLVHARTGILLYATGPKPIRLMHFRLPPGVREAELVGVLQNPNADEDPQFAMVSHPAEFRVGRD
ncbi:MAG: hypothetical protein AAF682_26115 [Planctomycetota bacterium]